MYINNEMGTINDNSEGIGNYALKIKLCSCRCPLQATGKIDFNLAELPVHAMSLSAHKTYGPKGVGALFVSQSSRVRLRSCNSRRRMREVLEVVHSFNNVDCWNG